MSVSSQLLNYTEDGPLKTLEIGGPQESRATRSDHVMSSGLFALDCGSC